MEVVAERALRCAVLAVDEARAREVAESLGSDASLEVRCVHSADGISADLVIMVVPRSDEDGETAIAALRRNGEVAVMVALPADAQQQRARFLEAGADEVLSLPVAPEEIRLRYRAWSLARAARADAPTARPAFPEIVGESEAMGRVFHQVYRVAGSDASVLLTGETGTGKELMARAIHTLSPRRDAPFMAVNLSAIPESLLEGELFGHEKGAFTGAATSRQGRIEAVAGGTLFLDEVGDLSLNVQVKLLRVLEERVFERLGASTPRTADFRLVCATHRDIEAMIADGSFREDLYYRINVVAIELPPLRERAEDLPLLARYFLRLFCDRYGVAPLSLTDGAMQALLRHTWPGNVRELQHIMERAVAMSSSGASIDEDVLWVRKPRVRFRKEVERYLEDGRGLREILADIERTMLVETLERYAGNQAAAAQKLKIPRQTLQNRLKKYGL